MADAETAIDLDQAEIAGDGVAALEVQIEGDLARRVSGAYFRNAVDQYHLLGSRREIPARSANPANGVANRQLIARNRDRGECHAVFSAIRQHPIEIGGLVCTGWRLRQRHIADDGASKGFGIKGHWVYS